MTKKKRYYAKESESRDAITKEDIVNHLNNLFNDDPELLNLFIQCEPQLVVEVLPIKGRA